MNPDLWARAKSLYLEASADPDGHQAYLDSVEPLDSEAAAIVRELLSQTLTEELQINGPCWSPPAAKTTAPALELGRTLLGRFEIVSLLGAGGMGEVYRAYDHQQSVFVALKTLRPSLASDATAISMLRNELNTARSVTSPYVCRLYDFHWQADANTPPFFTMELLEGETLAHYLRRKGPLSTQEAKPLVEHMIAALEAAHAQGIVHRDFKSANVMLTQQASRAVVMDFGLARELAPGASLEATLATATFGGTPAYMGPEQLRGKRATFASDLHALGVVLFEMVTGRRPFEGDGPLEIASRRLNEQAPSPRRYAPALDRRWDRTILRCLHADPNQRPPSASVVLELLEQPPPLLWNRRRILIAIGVAIPSAAGAGFWWSVAQTPPVEIVDVFDVENRTGDPALDFLCRGTTSEVIRRLTEFDGFSVIAIRGNLETSAAKSKGRFALSGSLSKQTGGEHLAIQIADKSAKKILWSRTYGAERLNDQIRLQAEIANDAETALIRHSNVYRTSFLSKLLPGSQRSHTASPTADAAAFDFYMRGSSLQQEYTEDSLRVAVGLFEAAVSRDPHFALALASLADCHLSLLNFGSDYDLAGISKARDYAQRAIREDPSLAEAHAVIGAVDQVHWDWPAAEAEYDRALKLKPNFAKAIRWRAGLVLQFARFDEAIAGLQKARQIDPYDRGAISTYGMALIFAGRLNEAVSIMEQEIGDRDMVGARYNLALANGLLAKGSEGAEAANLYAKGFAQARIIESIEHRSPGRRLEFSDRLKALLYSMRGDISEATPFLEGLERDVNRRKTSPGPNASIYAAQNRLDEAETALERAALLRDRLVIYLRVNPLFEKLRGRPRFEALLRTLRLK